MSSALVRESRNRLLRSLAAEDLHRLAPLVTRVTMKTTQRLVVANRSIEHVYFLDGGVASITSPGENGPTEIGVFGSEGVSGTSLLLGTDRTPHDVFMQVDGSHALRIGAHAFMDAVAESPGLQQVMLRYVHTMVVQMGQGSVANASRPIEARLARWLLMCHDRMQGDQIALTHEFMGMMIGAQRSGVTLALHALEGTGLIRSTRGLVTILTRDGLERLAGDSYGTAESEYRRLLGPFGKSAVTAPT